MGRLRVCLKLVKGTRPVNSSQDWSRGLLEDCSPSVNIAPETPSVSTAQDNRCHSEYCDFSHRIIRGLLYLGPVSEVGDAASRDGLSGVNLHTNGTEFYGNSSNLAFLGNLYARARNQSGSEIRIDLIMALRSQLRFYLLTNVISLCLQRRAKISTAENRASHNSQL